MSRKNWILFSIVGILWGTPYLLIRIAVRDFSPATVVCIRVTMGALILIPIAIKQKTISAAFRGIKYIIPYAIAEMLIPLMLIAKAETSISSGLTGILIATVPIWASIFASLHGDKTVWHHTRLIGLVVGFMGIFLLVGIESLTGHSALWAIAFVIFASASYAFAVNMITRKLPDVSGIAFNGIAMAITALITAPFAISQWPKHAVPAAAIFSVISLGLFCTALAFILFFIVIKEIGPARASLTTYLNTAVAVLLGVLILREPFTLGIAVGLPLVLYGSYLASRKTSQL